MSHERKRLTKARSSHERCFPAGAGCGARGRGRYQGETALIARARLRARALETVEGYALRAASATTLRVLCDALDDHADRAFSVHVPCRDNPFLDFSA